MCGVAGFAGVPEHARYNLTLALGWGIDQRGGDAAGFVSVSDRVTLAKRIGEWDDAKRRFIRQCATGNTVLMHARFATCGGKYDIDYAHPFTIKRDGNTVLWGAHNGVIYDADDSARIFKRKYTVDSKEILELVADDATDILQDLHGYGVLTWIDASDVHAIKIAKLTSDADIVVCRLAGGGYAYASTWKILGDALMVAGLRAEATYDLNEVGRVYRLADDGITSTQREGIKLSDGWNGFSSRWPYDYHDSPESWDKKWLEAYMKAENG